MKTGLFSLPSGEMTFHQALDYASGLGIDAIEPYDHAEFALPSTEEAKRLRDAAAEKGVGICCFSMMGDFSVKDVRAEVERLKQYAAVTAAMGSPYFHHTLIPRLKFGGNASFKEYLAMTVPAVREIFDYAQQLGVRCVYEDQGFVFNGVDRFDDLLGELDRDVGVVADLGNIYFVGETPEAFTARFASRVCHVHVKDYLHKDGCCPDPGQGWYVDRIGGYLRGTVIGHGEVNFTRVMQILNGVGYDGYYSIEYDGMEDAFMAQKLGLANLRRFEKLAQAGLR